LAISMASAVFPDAVAPSMAISFMKLSILNNYLTDVDYNLIIILIKGD
jgi:hypothetical protein